MSSEENRHEVVIMKSPKLFEGAFSEGKMDLPKGDWYISFNGDKKGIYCEDPNDATKVARALPASVKEDMPVFSLSVYTDGIETAHRGAKRQGNVGNIKERLSIAPVPIKRFNVPLFEDCNMFKKTPNDQTPTSSGVRLALQPPPLPKEYVGVLHSERYDPKKHKDLPLVDIDSILIGEEDQEMPYSGISASASRSRMTMLPPSMPTPRNSGEREELSDRIMISTIPARKNKSAGEDKIGSYNTDTVMKQIIDMLGDNPSAKRKSRFDEAIENQKLFSDDNRLGLSIDCFTRNDKGDFRYRRRVQEDAIGKWVSGNYVNEAIDATRRYDLLIQKERKNRADLTYRTPQRLCEEWKMLKEALGIAEKYFTKEAREESEKYINKILDAKAVQIKENYAVARNIDADVLGSAVIRASGLRKGSIPPPVPYDSVNSERPKRYSSVPPPKMPTPLFGKMPSLYSSVVPSTVPPKGGRRNSMAA